MENPIIQDYSNPQQGTMTSSQKQQNNQSNQRKQVFKVPPTHRDDRKLFVGGLPSNVTEDEFHDFFSQFGTLLDSIVMFDRETHRSRGFGFVTFEDPNVCTLLLNMCVEGTEGQGRVEMRGKVCEIKAAQPKESTNYNGNRGGGRRGGNNRGYRSYQQQQQQQGYPTNGEVYHQGYPPANGDGSSAVNPGVPSTLSGQPVMYPPYGMGAYYPPPAGMPGAAAYNPYMGYHAQDGHYYEHHASVDAYGAAAPHMPSVMTATAPGPHAQQNVLYGNGFVPVGGDNQEAAAARQADESPQGTSNGEEAKQT